VKEKRKELQFLAVILLTSRDGEGTRTRNHLNVFQVVPAFVLGVVLGLLAVRSGSIVPGMLFHLLYNGVLVGVPLLPKLGYTDEGVPLQILFHPVTTAVFAVLAVGFLRVLARALPPQTVDRTEGSACLEAAQKDRPLASSPA
jgi:hypothetical protein